MDVCVVRGVSFPKQIPKWTDGSTRIHGCFGCDSGILPCRSHEPGAANAVQKTGFPLSQISYSVSSGKSKMAV